MRRESILVTVKHDTTKPPQAIYEHPGLGSQQLGCGCSDICRHTGFSFTDTHRHICACMYASTSQKIRATCRIPQLCSQTLPCAGMKCFPEQESIFCSLGMKMGPSQPHDQVGLYLRPTLSCASECANPYESFCVSLGGRVSMNFSG